MKRVSSISPDNGGLPCSLSGQLWFHRGRWPSCEQCCFREQQRCCSLWSWQEAFRKGETRRWRPGSGPQPAGILSEGAQAERGEEETWSRFGFQPHSLQKNICFVNLTKLVIFLFLQDGSTLMTIKTQTSTCQVGVARSDLTLVSRHWVFLRLISPPCVDLLGASPQVCLLTSALKSLSRWCPSVALWWGTLWPKSTRSNCTRTKRETWRATVCAATWR